MPKKVNTEHRITRYERRRAALEKEYKGLGDLGKKFVNLEMYLGFLHRHFMATKVEDIFKATVRFTV